MITLSLKLLNNVVGGFIITFRFLIKSLEVCFVPGESSHVKKQIYVKPKL